MKKFLKIVKGNYLVVSEKRKCMFEIEADSHDEAQDIAKAVYEKRYGTIEEFMVVPIPDCITSYVKVRDVEKKDYDFDETCPYCDFVNQVVWDGHSHKMKCQNCGEEILLCNLCDPDNCECGNCPYEN